MAGSAHLENFSEVTIGAPVTTENTDFQRFEGNVQTAGTGINGYVGNGCQILNDQAVGGAGWYDIGWFDPLTPESPRKIVMTMYFRLDGEPIAAGVLHFAWLTSTPGAVDPIASLALDYNDGFEGFGLDVGTAVGDTYPSTGIWYRIVWEITENGEDADVELSMWIMQNIHSSDPSLREGSMTGTIVGGSALLENCWLLFGKHPNFTSTAAWQDLTLDSVAVSNAPWTPVAEIVEPGFFVAKGDDIPMPRAELLGQWDGSSNYDEIEFLGVWDGLEVVNPTPMVDTLWLETWAPNGVVGAPWTVVSGTPDKVDGTITDTATWMVRRAGASGDAYAGFYAVTVNGDAGLDAWWNNGTSAGIRVMIDANFFVNAVRYTLLFDGTVNRAIASHSIPDAEPQPTHFGIRRVGDVFEWFMDGYRVASGAITPAESAQLGSDVRYYGSANDVLGPVRMENL